MEEKMRLLSEDKTSSPSSSSSQLAKLKEFLKAVKNRLKKDVLLLLVLIVLNGLYLCFGGAVFYALEKSPRPVLDHRKHVEDLIKVFRGNSVKVNVTDSKVTEYVANISVARISAIVKQLHEIHLEIKNSEVPQWTVTRAVFFASTVVTTIGYGNLTPVTTSGRWFCVLYAMIGIPLTLMLLALVGRVIAKYINQLCAWMISTVKMHFYRDYQYDKVPDGTELQAPAWLAIALLLVWISLDACLFMTLEKWSFFKSVYFVFITLTTIGFGDIVPQNDSAIWFNVTILYISLAVFSITINLMIANITLQYKKYKDKIKIVKQLEKELNTVDNDEEIIQGTGRTADDVEEEARHGL